MLAGYLIQLYRYDGHFYLVHGDGFYSWLFARSLAFDGDLHLANDYQACGDPFGFARDEGGGRPANPFYLGPALLWAPILRVLRGIVRIPPDSPPDFIAVCRGPLATYTLLSGILCAVVALWCGYRVARRWVAPKPAAVAVLIVAFGSPLQHWTVMVPSYSHVYAAFGLALSMSAFFAAYDEPDSLARWALVGLAMGFMALMRGQQLVYLLWPGLVLAARLLRAVRERKPFVRPIVAGALVLVCAFAVFSIQLIAYKKLYGHYWVVPQGKSYLQLGHSHPFLLLFSARNGLLSWSPLMWLAVIPALCAPFVSDRRKLALLLLAPVVIDVYVSAAALDWHGNWSIGARRLVSLSPVFVVGIALSAQWIARWLERRPKRVGLVVAATTLPFWMAYNTGLSGGIEEHRAISGAELQGRALRFGLEKLQWKLGNPFVLPASAVFALRYRLPPSTFELISGGQFEHDYRTLNLRNTDTLDFAGKMMEPFLVEGLEKTNEGVLLRANTRGRFIVELAWPYVTDLRIKGQSLAGGPAVLRVKVGSFFVRRPAGRVTLEPTVAVKETPARGVFDSGINEVILQSDRDVRITSLQFVDTDKHDTSLY